MKKLNQRNRLYQLDIPIIGITGGIASGKSSFSSILKSNGLEVIDADKLVKIIYSKKESRNFIENISKDFIKDEEIYFPSLRKWFFENKENQKKVEDFIYQKLEKEFISASKLSNNKNKFILYDIPLLFEKKLQGLFDLTVCIYTGPQNQLSRLMARDNISEDLAKSILKNQMQIDLKKDLADMSIDNSGHIKSLELEALNFKQYLLSQFSSRFLGTRIK